MSLKFRYDGKIYYGKYHELVRVKPCELYPDGQKHVLELTPESGYLSATVSLSTRRLLRYKRNRKELDIILCEAAELEAERQAELKTSRARDASGHPSTIFLAEESDIRAILRTQSGELIIVMQETPDPQSFMVFKGGGAELQRLTVDQGEDKNLGRCSSDAIRLQGYENTSAWNLVLWYDLPNRARQRVSLWNDRVCNQLDLDRKVLGLNWDYSRLTIYDACEKRMPIGKPLVPALL